MLPPTSFHRRRSLQSMDAVSATIAMAEAQAKMGLHDDAISELRRAVRVHPRNSELHEKLGRILFQQQRYEAALPHLQKAIRKSEDSGELHMLVGNCALSTGRSKAALKSFERCMAISYKSNEALANIGRALIARRKADVAWQRLLDAFVDGGSTSEELHSVLEMCAPLVSEQVPSLASNHSEPTSSISAVQAPPGSIEAMAGIVQDDIVHEAIDLGMGLLEEEEEDTDNRLKISMPGSGLDTPESRAEWSQPFEEVSETEESDSWISSDHWDLATTTAIQTPETEVLPEVEIEELEEVEHANLPFQVGASTTSVETPDTTLDTSTEEMPETLPEPDEENVSEQDIIEMQEMPLPGQPVVASEDNALTQLAKLPQEQRVWCWTTSYGEVPWGMELLKSRPDDRIEAAKAELSAWTQQNPGIWLAVDLQVEGRVPVDINNVRGAIEGLEIPVILLVADQNQPSSWPVWGKN